MSKPEFMVICDGQLDMKNLTLQDAAKRVKSLKEKHDVYFVHESVCVIVGV